MARLVAHKTDRQGLLDEQHSFEGYDSRSSLRDEQHLFSVEGEDVSTTLGTSSRLDILGDTDELDRWYTSDVIDYQLVCPDASRCQGETGCADVDMLQSAGVGTIS